MRKNLKEVRGGERVYGNKRSVEIVKKKKKINYAKLGKRPDSF